MSDVTCKAVQTYFEIAKTRGVDPAELAAGIGRPLEFLRDKNNRIPWSEFVELGKRLRSLGNLTDHDLEEAGRGAFKSGPLRLVMSLARVLGDPARFYQWMQRGNKMLFANMQSRVEVKSQHQLIIHIGLREGDEQSIEYLLISKGAIASMPTLLGYPEAGVALRIRGPEASFEVTMRPKRRSFLRSAVQAVSGRYETAEELLATNVALTQRLEELSSANEQIKSQAELLDQQASRLQLAHEIGKLIHGTYDLQHSLDRIATTLLTHTVATAVRLAIHIEIGATQKSVEARAGTNDSAATHVVSLPITSHGAEIGTLWLSTGSADAERALADSLEYVLPVLAMAIDNARAYSELEEYQHGLERKVEERTAELREAQEARERIFANISHEIRTPLSLILLAVADVETRASAQLDAASRDNLTSVVDSARKLLRLVDELLLLAAGRETQLRLNPQPTDLAALVAALAVTWRPAAEAAGLRLGHDGPDSLVTMADPVAFERVVTNLVSNAVKFTPQGGRISITLEQIAANAVLTVRDTGIGIDDDLLKRLFGRFERGRASGAGRGGSGIGLSLVKELVEAHDGAVSVARLDAGGTEFKITVPLVEATVPAQDTTAPRLRPGDYGIASAPVSSGEVYGDGRSAATILVAEDDPRLAAMIARLLSEEYTVVVALDGLAALDLVRQHQPHLLVTDVDMPGMDGVELTRRFRQITDNRLAPVVILSANADPTTRLAGLEAGAVDYVVKPFDPVELKARVRSQLRMRDLALRLHRAEQLSALGTLSSGLAHELRNPANGIVNAVGPLKKLLPEELRGPNSGVGQLVAVLGSCAEQIAFLSRQLLSFKRGGDLELRTVPLGDIVERALTLAQPALRDVAVREHVADQKPVRCAPPLLVQVLTNLVENAAHAAGAGGWVEIASIESNGTLTVEVADSGPGVPIELRERIFEPFFTTKPPGVGTGLGLPLARDIVHRHGGVLEIRERDQRSVFVVEIPNPPS